MTGPGLTSAVLIGVMALSACEPALAGPGWRRPVEGGVSRAFLLGRDPFAAGAHRGVDLAAAPGSRVVSACGGTVRFSGRLPGGSGAVTVACGPWRVTHLPLRDSGVEVGRHVRAGEAIGVLASDARHSGLHVGVRRAGERHGYVDPQRLLPAAGGASDEGPPLVGRRGPRGAAPARPPGPVRAPVPLPVVPLPGPHPAPASAALAPAPVWIGLALILLAGLGARRRSRRARPRPVATQEPRAAVR